MSTPTENLERLEAFFSDPKRFSRNAFARTADGKTTFALNKNAVSWNLVGAYFKCMNSVKSDTPEIGFLNSAIIRLYPDNALFVYDRKRPKVDNVLYFSDYWNTRHKDAMNVIRLAKLLAATKESTDESLLALEIRTIFSLREPDINLTNRYGGICPKCSLPVNGQWSDCRGKCPILISPNYDLNTQNQAIYASLDIKESSS